MRRLNTCLTAFRGALSIAEDKCCISGRFLSNLTSPVLDRSNDSVISSSAGSERPPVGSYFADPHSFVKVEISSLSERLRQSVSNDVPDLKDATSFFFKAGAEGKRLRPTIVLLMASSLSNETPGQNFLEVDTRAADVQPMEERRQQQRVAEVSELIHVATLLHDDVIDESDTRRGLASINSLFGNKVAVLAGDFLLARASITLAALNIPKVTMLLSKVIEDLVSGEVLQMTENPSKLVDFNHYLTKTYYKTASLIANSCKCAAVVAKQPENVVELAYDYGRNLGLAYQLVDDVMDFTSSSATMGKPALNDLKSGLATAPVLYAAEEFPELWNLIERQFKSDGDVKLAEELVFKSKGIDRTRDLASKYCQAAIESIANFPPTENENARCCRQALVDIIEKVLTRVK